MLDWLSMLLWSNADGGTPCELMNDDMLLTLSIVLLGTTIEFWSSGSSLGAILMCFF